MVHTEVYQHCQMSNNCTNLALLKSNYTVYFIRASALSIIEIVLKIFYQMQMLKSKHLRLW